jgi:hypothetical protein
MTTHKFDKDVQGMALYLEFRRVGATAQVIVTPDGFTTASGVTSAVFFRRVITSGVTKRKWRGYTLRNTAQFSEYLGTGTTASTGLDKDEVLDTAISRSKNLTDYFDSLRRQGYLLVQNRPIYVEVTKADLDSAQTSTLPAKVWTRIKASRAAIGFPEDLVDSPTSATVPTSTPAY